MSVKPLVKIRYSSVSLVGVVGVRTYKLVSVSMGGVFTKANTSVGK